jgi:hypothetical protein
VAQTCLTALLLAAVLFGTGCLPDARRLQMARLFDQLADAGAELRQGRSDPACQTVGDVNTRLIGEPGLTELRDTWPHMRDATQALLAVCGQLRLLQQPFDDTAAMLAARDRWQAGVERELGVACERLKLAGRSVDRVVDC